MMDVKKLINAAIKGRDAAYTPYSQFKVGAALWLKNDEIITGCNVENASYGLCNCAERTALFKAYSEGYQKEDILAMAVVADTAGPVSPCGACRQVMSELLLLDTPIYMTNLKGAMYILTVKELLPYSFSESDLK